MFCFKGSLPQVFFMGTISNFTKICRDIQNFVFIAGVVDIGDKLLAGSLLLVIKPCPGSDYMTLVISSLLTTPNTTGDN
jgi:hypothetical protein